MLIRWEKKIENYLAMIHLACAWITFRATGLFGEAFSSTLVDQLDGEIKIKRDKETESRITFNVQKKI